MISLFNSIGLGPSPTRLERTVATTAFYTRLAANRLSSAVTRGSRFFAGSQLCKNLHPAEWLSARS